MGSTLEQLEKNVAKLRIEVDAAVFDKALEKAYKKNAKKFKIPGFRIGKAPQHIVEQYYGEAVFYEDAINDVFPDAFREAVEEQNITPVDLPQIEDIVQIGRNKNLILAASVTVKPDVILGEYKGIEAEKPVYNVTDEDIENELRRLQERNARLVTVEDRAAQVGDVITIDYTGYIDNKPIENGSAENQDIELGKGQFIPGFEEQLIGLNKGDKKEFKIVFPESYGSSLAGKEAMFSVTVKEIRYKELPTLDDEFAKDVSEFDTLEELRQSIKERLESEAVEMAEDAFEDAVIAKVVENSQVDIPEVMVQNEIENILYNIDMNLRYQGLSLDAYLDTANISMDAMKERYREEAYRRVKTRLVLEKIGDVEGIKVSDEEVENELKNRAEQMKVDIEYYSQHVDRSSLEATLKMRKIISFLVGNAKVVEKAGNGEVNEKGSAENMVS